MPLYTLLGLLLALLLDMLLVMVMGMYLYEVPASTESTGSMLDKEKLVLELLMLLDQLIAILLSLLLLLGIDL